MADARTPAIAFSRYEGNIQRKAPVFLTATIPARLIPLRGSSGSRKMRRLRGLLLLTHATHGLRAHRLIGRSFC